MRRVFEGLLAACALAACGGSDSPSTAPAKITLTSAGANPTSVSLPSGGQVTFVNNDTADHQIASTSCPEIASANKLSTGGSFTSSAITGAKSCSFSDALNPSNTAFNGTVTVSAPGTGGGGGAGY